MSDTTAALAEELDRCRAELRCTREAHEAELQEVAEEMAAAARFSDNEWREECRKAREFACRGFAAALELLPGAEEAARRRLQDEEEAQRCDLQGPRWEASLEETRAREAARAEAAFAARGLSMSELRRTHLGKGRATEENSYAAGEGLYKLFLALRPGGPVEWFNMRELLKTETDVWHIRYHTLGRGTLFGGKHFAIPAADGYELAACVLCHLPALEGLALRELPALSARSLEWVSRLPPSLKDLRLLSVGYTVADLRELHRRRRHLTFTVCVQSSCCDDWGDFAGSQEGKIQVNAELGGMIRWWN